VTRRPGTRLKKWFTRLGFETCCRCERLAETMDREGVDWCMTNVDWIADRVMHTAKKRGWGDEYRPVVLAAVYFACQVPLMEIPSSTIRRVKDKLSI